MSSVMILISDDASQDMEDRQIELEALQKALQEGAGL